MEGVLINVSFNSTDTTLVIVSRDCISSPEDYTLVVTFINTLNQLEQVPYVISLNFSSTVTVVLDMEEELTPDTLYNVSVEIVETTSGIVIDEMNTTIRTPHEPSWLHCYYFEFITEDVHNAADIGRPDSVQSKTNITYVAVGICGAFLVVVMCVIVVLVMVAIMKKQSQQPVAGMYIRIQTH